MIRALFVISLVLLVFRGQTHLVLADEQDDTSSLPSLEILLKFFDSTRGLRWSDHTNWLQDDNLCSWHGIKCYDEGESDQRRVGHVKELDLTNNRLVGTLPTEIYELPYISSIVFRENPDLVVVFDNIEAAQYLRTFVISNTRVATLVGLDAAVGLEELHITNLQLAGSFPSEVLALTTLTGLYANYNSFSGTIPTAIGMLTKLEKLYAFDNDLSGQLPSEIGLLTGLKVLTFAHNAFSGSLPSQLSQLEHLEILAIQRDGQKPKGPGISGPLPSFDTLSEVTEIYFENQKLSGPIPSDFLDSAPTDQVVKVFLENNRLTGTVPAGLTRLNRLNLYLEHNEIEALPEGFCDQIEGWMGGDIQSMGCDAFLCPPGTYALGGRKTQVGPCQSCPSVQFYGSAVCGEEPSSPSEPVEINEREVLIEMYNAMGGRFWKEDNNWLSPGVDICSWHGIQCEQGSVVAIVLKNNRLVNTLPERVFSLPNLERLNLNSNSIDFSFKEISKATNLALLDLTHSDLPGLASIEELAQTRLEKLKLGSNDLRGELPLSIFSLTALTELHVSHNKFSGSLPTDIGRLSNLQKLQLYGNDLTGQLPSEIGSLRGLVELAIAENGFSGPLPTALEELTALTLLSLHQTTSSHSLTGPLPAFRNLAQLTSLHLDSNQLTGPLPEDLLAETELGDELIEIHLGDNLFTGMVPAAWASRFDELDLDLTGNRITSIAPEVCDSEDWMNEAVGRYHCDAILCPAGTFNEFGRTTDNSSPCRQCPDGGTYLGVKACSQEEDNSDLAILKELYFASNGAAWQDSTGWIQSNDYCNDWVGVSCNGDREVIKIDLSNNLLAGSIPTSLFRLRSLQELDLQGNRIRISFEGFEKATSLEILFLSDTDLDSIIGIGAGTALTALHLTDNDLTGTIPAELFNLSNLKVLFLNYNRFSGRIPAEIGQLVHLEELYLYNNHLEGQIPAAIGSLKKIRVFALTENFLTGTLPEELNELTELRLLSIQREKGEVDGEPVSDIENSPRISTGLRGKVPSLNRLKYLEELYLGANSLTGSIPFDFLNGVEDKTAPIVVDLISNRLTGRVPASLTQFDQLTIFLGGNFITEIADGLCQNDGWMRGDMGDFGCDALLCPPNTANKFGRRYDGDALCHSCANDTSTPYYGSFECLSGASARALRERDILVEFFHSMDGSNWHISTNWMNFDVSFCTWQGVSCVAENVESVISIGLPQNSLEGVIPTSLFSLPNLTDINLSGNNITVRFWNITEPTSVTYMDLDSTGSMSIDGIADAMPGLVFLHINDNDFLDFPIDLFRLSNLEVLSLSDNQFSGEFPAPLDLLRKLVFLAISDCGFNGTLTTGIGRLTNLEFLALDGNSLSGTIPTEIMRLSSLKHLDLSDQISRGGEGFSGNLTDFAGLTILSELDLSRNEISGSIPDTFLLDVNLTATVTVDLSDNAITGTIPSDLASRFPSNFNIYLANNMIDAVPDAVCGASWNDIVPNGQSCDHILCNKGSFNSIGRATADNACAACPSANFTLFFGSTQCGEDLEKDILSSFFVDTAGSDWKNSEGWIVDPEVCHWHGITCHEEGAKQGYVRRIVLPNNNMVGKVSPSIYELLYLERLELKQNQILMNFSNIGNAQSLQTLHLSQTATKNISGIGDAKSLVALHLTSNGMMGPFPDELLGLTNLERLYVNYNNFTGPLSEQIGALSHLKEVYFFNNLLSGSIPSEIGLLTDLVILGLGENDFTGHIPEEMKRLTNLQVLSLQERTGLALPGLGALENSAKGMSGPIFAFDNFPNLNEVYLGGNNFEGTIPLNFLSGVQNKSETIRVDLTMNHLTGKVPKSLAEFDDLRIFLAGNNIDEVPSEICDKGNWMGGLVSTGCDAFLCRPGFYNEYGRQISEDRPCEVCAFNSSSSQYYGAVACEVPTNDDGLDERAILFEFYTATGGNKWLNRNNWLEDNRSICDWHGVHCASEDGLPGETVTRIELPANGLTGTVPAVVFHLPSLQVLNIRKNDVDFSFTGVELSLTLERLSLDSTKVKSLRGVGGAKVLKVLHLEDNAFGGLPLPDEIFDILTLKQLHASNSGFVGTLPTMIGALAALEELYFHKNDLTGTIPSEIGKLGSIRVMDLSENLFVGNLPTQISRLSTLRSLLIDAFTRNSAGISGPLRSFERLSNLQDLYLGANSFTGTIPHNFLASVSTTKTITVGLRGNELTGMIPIELSRLSNLNIDLSDNKIDVVNQTLCERANWMGGAVGQFGCPALLCPPMSFNRQGMQTSASNPCIPCSGIDASPHYGSTTCSAIQKEKEREILELFFQLTGGPNWKRKDFWLDETVDICKWYGISCRSELSVASITLGANNLVGTPPKQIFELPNLHFLWLYSNPISFSFEGIEKAETLTSLLLDSTGLESLDGIGKAVSLVDLDVRFNSVKGQLPAEIKDLRKLQSFSCANNLLTGPVPDFATNQKLVTLRLGTNRFTGTVPSFDSHREMTTLDLSDNELRGTIPSNLLETADVSAEIFLDLSSNALTGTVPGTLERFDHMTLLLKDNQISGIDPSLCDKSSWNDNDLTIYKCDGILCPPGHFSPGTGRGSKESTNCFVCEGNEFYGSSTCGPPSRANRATVYLTTLGLGIVAAIPFL